jgi:ABC-type Fe3+ transport system permease subunit
MNRAFLIVLIPAALVGLGYVLVFRHAGIPVRPLPLVMATVGFLIAAGLVHRYQRRKRRARSS